MLKIKIKSANSINAVTGGFQEEIMLTKQYIWIGRGEQVKQKQNQRNAVMSLRDLSKSISRIHACIIISPFYFRRQQPFPSYYRHFNLQSKIFPHNLLKLIRQFCKPAKHIILKDCQSKTGIYKKITSCTIQAGTQIILGDNKKITFQHREIYDTTLNMMERIKQLKLNQYKVLKEQNLSFLCKSFWVITSKNQKFILCDEAIKIQFGRSSSCDYVINNDPSISRKHAFLQYQQHGIWKLLDGDGQGRSSNGVWKKMKKIMLNDGKHPISKQKIVKFGDLSLAFSLRQALTIQSMKYLCQSTNSSSNSQNQKSLQLQQSLLLSKKSSI